MRIIISAGGTGGHLIPAKKLAKELLEKNHSILFAAKGLKGNRNFKEPLNKSLFQRSREILNRNVNLENELTSLKVSELENSNSGSKDPRDLKNGLVQRFLGESFNFVDIKSSSSKKDFFTIGIGILQSLSLLLKFKPDVVIGFGSYHTFPVLFAALILRKKILLFEPNTSLGKVNRFFAKSAKAVAVQFLSEELRNGVLIKPFSPGKLIEKEKALEELKLNPNLITFLVFGGSQGAKFINETFVQMALLLKEKGYLFQVIHLTGGDESIKKRYEEMNIFALVKGFEENMALAYSAADIVISRAGAGTISELISFEKPSLLIPYPFSSEGHQDKNGSFMQDELKVAIKIEESKASAEKLTHYLEELFKRKEFFKRGFFEIKRKLSLAKDLSDLVVEIGSEK